MNARIGLVILFLSTAWWCAPAPAIGQSVQRQKPDVRVYHLRHGRPGAIEETLLRLNIDADVISDDTAGSLVVNTTTPVHDEVARLIKLLDVSAKEESSTTAFISLIHRDARDIGHLVQPLINAKRTRVAADLTNQILVLKGLASDIAAARDLVKQLDRPARMFRLSFIFLRADVGGGSAADLPELPKGLRDVADALSANGLSGLRLLAPLTVSVEEKASYSSSGYLQPEDGASFDFRVKGDVLRGRATDDVTFTVRAEVVNGRGEFAREVFSARTTITAPLGDYVVLAAAPSSSGDGDAIVLVVRAE